MSRKITSYTEKVVQVPASIEYTCDTCGYVFAKGERKVSYNQGGKKSKQYACYDKPCSPFSNPKNYEYVWDIERQDYVWQTITTPKDKKGEREWVRQIELRV